MPPCSPLPLRTYLFVLIASFAVAVLIAPAPSSAVLFAPESQRGPEQPLPVVAHLSSPASLHYYALEFEATVAGASSVIDRRIVRHTENAKSDAADTKTIDAGDDDLMETKLPDRDATDIADAKGTTMDEGAANVAEDSDGLVTDADNAKDASGPKDRADDAKDASDDAKDTLDDTKEAATDDKEATDATGAGAPGIVPTDASAAANSASDTSSPAAPATGNDDSHSSPSELEHSSSDNAPSISPSPRTVDAKPDAKLEAAVVTPAPAPEPGIAKGPAATPIGEATSAPDRGQEVKSGAGNNSEAPAKTGDILTSQPTTDETGGDSADEDVAPRKMTPSDGSRERENAGTLWNTPFVGVTVFGIVVLLAGLVLGKRSGVCNGWARRGGVDIESARYYSVQREDLSNVQDASVGDGWNDDWDNEDWDTMDKKP